MPKYSVLGLGCFGSDCFGFSVDVSKVPEPMILMKLCSGCDILIEPDF
ncbi:hypothetical protein [Desulfosediminicola sp.]